MYEAVATFVGSLVLICLGIMMVGATAYFIRFLIDEWTDFQ